MFKLITKCSVLIRSCFQLTVWHFQLWLTYFTIYLNLLMELHLEFPHRNAENILYHIIIVYYIVFISCVDLNRQLWISESFWNSIFVRLCNIVTCVMAGEQAGEESITQILKKAHDSRKTAEIAAKDLLTRLDGSCGAAFAVSGCSVQPWESLSSNSHTRWIHSFSPILLPF